MKRSLPSVWAVWLVALTACHVQETHTRCATSDECGTGEECYLGFCVLSDAEPSESSSSAATRRDAAVSSDASTRMRPRTQTGSTREQADDGGGRVSMDGTSKDCVASDEDAGASEGACCTAAVSCYSGPDKTAGVGRCKAGKRACKNGRLGACEGAVQPRAESCDNEGADDDCDGIADNVRNRGKTCTLDASAKACGQGVYNCVDGQKGLQCVPEKPPAEVCNNKDDDCDSKVDEGFDLKKDAMNCGACGTRCSNTQACCGGACTTRVNAPGGCPECSATQACEMGKSCCGGSCSDLQNDHENCGSCGKACGGRETCCGGACVDTRSNQMNCGRCGMTCAQGAPTCCNGSCVDLTSNQYNCGQCGRSCGFTCMCSTTNGQSTCQGPLGGVCF